MLVAVQILPLLLASLSPFLQWVYKSQPAHGFVDCATEHLEALYLIADEKKPIMRWFKSKPRHVIVRVFGRNATKMFHPLIQTTVISFDVLDVVYAPCTLSFVLIESNILDSR